MGEWVGERQQDRRPTSRLEAAAILGALLAMFAGLGSLISGVQTVHWGLVAGIALLSVLFFRGPHAVLRRYRAEPLSEGTHPAIVEQIRSLSERAGLEEPPELRVTTRDCDVFSVATPHRATIVIGRSLLDRFDARLLDAVLAHEVSHIKNRDTAVMGLADLVVRMTRTMSQLGLLLVVANVGVGLFADTPVPWGLVIALIVTPLFGKLLFGALGRAREFRADRDAAALTGDPEAIAEALLALEAAPRPKKSLLRALNPYGFAPSPSELRSHPPTAVRVQRLRELA